MMHSPSSAAAGRSCVLVARWLRATAAPWCRPRRRAASTFEAEDGVDPRVSRKIACSSCRAPPAPPPPPPTPAPQPEPPAPAPAAADRPAALLKDDEPRIRRRAALAIGRTRRGRRRRAAGGRAGGRTAIPRCARWPRSRSGCSVSATAADALTPRWRSPIRWCRAAPPKALGLIGHKAGGRAIARHDARRTSKAGVLAGIAAGRSGLPEGADRRSRAARHVCAGAARRVRRSSPRRWSTPSGAPRQPLVARRLCVPRRRRSPCRRRCSRPCCRARDTSRARSPRAGWASLKHAAARSRRSPRSRRHAVRTARPCGSKRPARWRRLGDAASPATLMKILTTPEIDPNLRLEAVTALGQLRAPRPWTCCSTRRRSPGRRCAAASLVALARDRPGHLHHRDLRPRPRSAVDASARRSPRALGALAASGAVTPVSTPMLADDDQRVIPAVLTALVATGASSATSCSPRASTPKTPSCGMAAANGLARLKATDQVPALVAAYERSAEGSAPTWRARPCCRRSPASTRLLPLPG